jgi:hypothetical protein
MKGNFHVRFLEGGGLATARPYSVKTNRVVRVKNSKATPGEPGPQYEVGKLLGCLVE